MRLVRAVFKMFIIHPAGLKGPWESSPRLEEPGLEQDMNLAL
jgi:hypothetical protein